MPTLGNSNIEILIKTTADGAGIKETEQAIGGLNEKLTASNKIGQFFAENYKAAAVASAGLLTAMGLGTVAALDQASAYQQNRVAFETMLGSAEKAKTLLKQVSDFAAATPFQLPEVVEGAKKLLAFGVAGDDVISTFKTMGNIAAGVGTDKLPLLINVFGQVKSAGRLMSQDLLQFTSAGVPIIDLLAKHFGTTASKVRDMVETGKVGFGDLKSSLELLGGPAGKWGDLMDKQSKTLGGTLSNVQDQMGRILRQAVGIGPDGDIRKGSFFDVATKGATVLLSALASVSPYIEGFFAYFEHNRTAANALLGALGGLAVLAAGAFIGAFGGAIAIMLTFAVVGARIGALWTDHKVLAIAVAAAVTALGVALFQTNIQAGILALRLGALGLVGAAVTVATWAANAATWAWTAAQWALNIALDANPIGLVILAIAALVAGTVLVVTHWNEWKDTINDVWHALFPLQAATVDLTGKFFAAMMQSQQLTAAHKDLQLAMDKAKASTDALRDAQYSQTGAALAVEQAQRNYNEAVRQYGPSSLEARQAAYNLQGANSQLSKSNDAVRDAQNKAADSARNVESAHNVLNQKLQESKGHVDRSRDSWGGLIGQIGAYATKLLNLPSANLLHDLHIPGFATGVRNFSGGLAVVGERGPELVNLPRGADVYSSSQSRGMAAAGPTGPTFHNTYNIYNQVDIEEANAKMAWNLANA